ncbi:MULTISPECIES: VirB3 family type IV secretion system protein [Burkholderia]|uniref:VirB3 family type IV secretion system protein n=1 Tax=Burkholderia TaxID=32008 RepID=UPI00053896DA|nr:MULTISPECIES: VirB3 family type IV secretion system protein [Burkholderia]KGV74348.1 type IV secretory pathway, VirB3-like family protein [Burkholderia pseudomallei MSHR4299]KGW11030.1 type IV secretory pathway, VirB3-like family protein [Burkholderia pseudomallei MSHR4000]KGX19170.1 type IV secretory pathway, VirB3-like family protein [Burkholderia pseudomallei ABCPW 1]KWN79249.1 type IV secretion system protein VirB3 [Burkholderia ubonensis]
MSEKKKYPSYAGLGRVAMYWGVPLIPLLIVVAGSIFCAFVATAFLGPGGLLFVTLGVPFLLYIREVCATDDQALRVLWLEIQCVFRRRNFGLFGKTLTLAPMKYGRLLELYRRPFRRPTPTVYR